MKPDPCCTAMYTATLTSDDLRRDPETWEGQDLSEWEPTVVWCDHTGAFVIGHSVIFFCPWCGAQLPDNTEAAKDKARREGVWVEVAADGRITATLKGQPVDPDALFAELKDSTREQD